MFVAPPPKTQRLLHSEAYLKYIEGLSAESNSISKWDQTLAGKESPQEAFSKSMLYQSPLAAMDLIISG